MRYFLLTSLLSLYLKIGYAFESNEFITEKFYKDVTVTKVVKSPADNVVYLEESSVNYPQLKAKHRASLPEVNVAGFHVRYGLLYINDSSHMYFTFDGAVFMVDY